LTSADDDAVWMAEAVQLGRSVRSLTSPNPWVGAVLVPADHGPVALGATAPPGGPHAEACALELAGAAAAGATVYTTLEPCSHHGRTPPCADALIEAGVARVVVGVEDPDPQVAGEGIARLRKAGVVVDVGVAAPAVRSSLAPYLKQRATGRPWVVLKMAATLDGRTAAPDGTSQWITGPLARADVHQLRAESDAIVVGAGTVRADDPSLTVRAAAGRDPQRIVLGAIPDGARVRPARSFSGDPAVLLESLGGEGVIQLLVEGGATVAGDWHRRGLVDQYVVYLAPALMGGSDGRGLFGGPGAATMADVFRGRIASIRPIGPDVRIDLLSAAGEDAVP
jgi:diaminohydroxyphosphoribosylaminopyrimidine deaminase/5-amino-6-(5-phosphoribosylamino)uracil reductase